MSLRTEQYRVRTINYRPLRDSHTIEGIFDDIMNWMDSLDDAPDAMTGPAALRNARGG